MENPGSPTEIALAGSTNDLAGSARVVAEGVIADRWTFSAMPWAIQLLRPIFGVLYLPLRLNPILGLN